DCEPVSDPTFRPRRMAAAAWSTHTMFLPDFFLVDWMLVGFRPFRAVCRIPGPDVIGVGKTVSNRSAPMVPIQDSPIRSNRRSDSRGKSRDHSVYLLRNTHVPYRFKTGNRCLEDVPWRPVRLNRSELMAGYKQVASG